MKQLIVLWGPPASGKSSVAQNLCQLYQERFGYLPCHLGTDRLNDALIGSDYQADIRPCLYRAVVDLAISLLSAGRVVIVEGTFLRGPWLQKLEELAREQEVTISKVMLTTRLGLLLKRNGLRPQPARVPSDFIKKSHRAAKEQEFRADYVFDSELVKPERLARFLFG